MSQCETCIAGLGMITVYRLDKMVSITCPACKGIGYTCNRCLGNPATCKCDDRDKSETKRKDRT